MPETSSQENITVFCCYAQEDQLLFRELKNHLMPLQREKYISLWSDIDINAGAKWKEEIYRHLNTAHIILLLVSADFMASNDCDDIKKRALERHKSGEAKVIPILLRPVDWWKDPLSELQALPSNNKPVTSWGDKDIPFSNITKGIRKIVEQLIADRASSRPVVTKAGQQESTSSSIASNRTTKWILHSTLTGHAMAVNSVAINTNQQILVSGSADKTIKVWDLSTGRITHTLIEHTMAIQCVAISTNGQNLVSGSADKTIKVWNLDTGQLVQNLTGHVMAVNSVAINTNQQILVSGSADKTIKVWNLDTGRLVQNLTGHIDIISSIAIGIGGQIVISGSYDKTVKVWDISTRRCIRTLTNCTHRIWSVAISTDERIVACGCENGIIKVWSLDTGQVVHTLTDYSTSITSVAISIDGQTLVSGSNNTIKMWDLFTGQMQQTLTGRHTHAISSIAISEDRHTLISGGYDSTIKMWRAILQNEK